MTHNWDEITISLPLPSMHNTFLIYSAKLFQKNKQREVVQTNVPIVIHRSQNADICCMHDCMRGQTEKSETQSARHGL